MANTINTLKRLASVLETPRHTGYRPGMSATGLIGRKLALVYDVADHVPSEMGAVLDRIGTKEARGR